MRAPIGRDQLRISREPPPLYKRIPFRVGLLFVVAIAVFVQLWALNSVHLSDAKLNTLKSPIEDALDNHTQRLSSPRSTTKSSAMIAVKTEAPRPKMEVAYAISITSCPTNTTSVIDGPAVLAYSIHHVSKRYNASISKYDYKLYAFIHPSAQNCTNFLTTLGYQVQIRDLPFSANEIRSDYYQTAIEEQGCCGSKEFLKLWAYTLVQHEIVVHLDTDIAFLQPLDQLFDAMLADNATTHTLPTMFQKEMPNRVDFFFTRDYLQRSTLSKDPSKYGVQGGFYVARPSMETFDRMIQIVLEGDFTRNAGWGQKRYGGFWGAPQIQGFLSYFYGEVAPQSAVELNRCIYNSMIDDDPMHKGTCRTGETVCEDCRETPLDQIKTFHLTTCWKPWHVSTSVLHILLVPVLTKLD